MSSVCGSLQGFFRIPDTAEVSSSEVHGRRRLQLRKRLLRNVSASVTSICLGNYLQYSNVFQVRSELERFAKQFRGCCCNVVLTAESRSASGNGRSSLHPKVKIDKN